MPTAQPRRQMRRDDCENICRGETFETAGISTTTDEVYSSSSSLGILQGTMPARTFAEGGEAPAGNLQQNRWRLQKQEYMWHRVPVMLSRIGEMLLLVVKVVAEARGDVGDACMVETAATGSYIDASGCKGGDEARCEGCYMKVGRVGTVRACSSLAS